VAADLHIHILTDEFTEGDARTFMSNTLGSKWFAGFGEMIDKEPLYAKITDTPDIWIGEVSWLKAALFEDGEENYIPGHVQAVYDAIGEDFPIIDGDLIAKIDAAFGQPNTSIYTDGGFERTHKEVMDFMRKHVGKRCFTVSW